MFAFLQFIVTSALAYAAFGAGVWGLIDAARRTPEAFVAAGKQTKTLWLIVLAIATAILFIALPFPFGSGSMSIFNFVGLLAAAAVIIYFVGVKPSLGQHRRGGGSRPPRNTGGW